MKVIGKKSVSSLILFFLQALLLFGCMVYVLLPILLRRYLEWFNPSLNYYNSLILLYVSGIPAIIIVAKLIKLFHTIKLENPFIMENVNSLKVISYASVIIAIEYVFGFFFVTNSIFGLVVVGGFIIAWLGSYVLAELLAQAVRYKEENDLTI